MSKHRLQIGRRADGGVQWDPQRESVLAKHEWMVRRFCASRLRDPCDAEDAAQDTLIRFLLHEGEIQSPEGWLINTARGVCVDLARRNHIRRTEPLTETVAAVNSDPQEQVVHAHTVADILRSLQEPDRQLLGKLYLGGVSVEQMAALLHVSKGNVRIMAMRARRRAAVALGEVSRGAVGTLPFVWGHIRRAGGSLRQRLSSLRGASGNADALTPAFNLAAAAAQVLVPFSVATILLATGGPASPPPGPHAFTARDARMSLPGPPGGAPPRTSASQSPASRTETATVQPAPPTPVAYGPAADVNNLLHPNPSPSQQDAAFSSMSLSPDYANDHTILASGAVLRGCSGSCSAVYRTSDSGASWQHLPSSGFLGGALLLSPHYPQDHIVFALSPPGVQESDDGGATFRLIAPTVAAAAVAPDSAAGNPRLLLGNEPLLWYSGGSVQPGPVLPAALTDITGVAFGPDGAILVTGDEQDPPAPSGVTSVIVRCTSGCAVIAAYPGQLAMRFVESPTVADDHTIVAFNNRQISISTDGGQAFTGHNFMLPGMADSVAILPRYDQTHGMLIGWAPFNGPYHLGVSRDAGNSAAELPTGAFPKDFALSQLLATPDGRWFVAMNTPTGQGDFGIRCSTDQGDSWAYSC